MMLSPHGRSSNTMSQVRSQEGDAGRGAGQIEEIAQRMLAALGAVRVSSLSFHDEDADVLWLNESVLGPDEHEAVRVSLEVFAGEGSPLRHEHDLGDGRVAVTWPASHGGGSVLGVAMAIVDQRATSVGRATLDGQGIRDALRDFALWLAADISATQLRLRALPDLSAQPPEPEHTLAIVDYVAQVRATPAPAAAAAPEPIDPMLERHFAALRAQPIELYAQRLEPIGEGNRIRRYEVLLRTRSEHGRNQAPLAMLEAATRKGLGTVVDRRVLTELIVWLTRNAALWRTDPIAVTVNLSPTSLVDPNFLKFLELCLGKSGLPRGMIGFELDTMVCIQQPKRVAEFSEVLAALGCKLVLDDFAVQEGHKELLGLKGLRMLKIHPALMPGLATDKLRRAVVAGIAQMARTMGMHACAKGVESAQDAPLLAALKVDFAQGFAFAEPHPLKELAP